MSDKHKRNFQNASKRLNTKKNISDDLENLNSTFLYSNLFLEKFIKTIILSNEIDTLKTLEKLYL